MLDGVCYPANKLRVRIARTLTELKSTFPATTSRYARPGMSSITKRHGIAPVTPV